VIPVELRERTGLGPGDEVSFAEIDEGIVVRRVQPRQSLRGRYGGSGMASRLLEDRRRERP
jgi:bifunctional DNA-binding transcriptional regulator/antitoxin component of YhaV-PrlF toxin-antitoxin module